jgi:hypothetical protein
MTCPGVGVVVAASFSAAVEAPAYFRHSRSIGAYLGLTPRRNQSGEIDHSAGVSKRGDQLLRSYLFEAAASLLVPRAERVLAEDMGAGARATAWLQAGSGCGRPQDRCRVARHVEGRQAVRGLAQRNTCGPSRLTVPPIYRIRHAGGRRRPRRTQRGYPELGLAAGLSGPRAPHGGPCLDTHVAATSKGRPRKQPRSGDDAASNRKELTGAVAIKQRPSVGAAGRSHALPPAI